MRATLGYVLKASAPNHAGTVGLERGVPLGVLGWSGDLSAIYSC